MKEKYIGQRVTRPDALAKVTGQAQFAADIAVHRDDLLHAKALYPPYGHARILSIDTSEAEHMPGVVCVMTAKDLPAGCTNKYGADEPDKPIFAENKIVYEGDAVAAVAAETLAQAEAAAAKIRVTYEPLPAYEDPRELRETYPSPIHENHPISGQSPVSLSATVRNGDPGPAFEQADVVLDHWYRTPMADHAYLEPDVCIVEPDPVQGGLTIWSPQHAVQNAKQDMAKLFGLPQSKVRVIGTLAGGGFGGKEDSTYDVSTVAAALAMKTGKPVSFEFTRDEVFRNTGKRHAEQIHHRLAADREGNLLAIDVDAVIDKGAYRSVDILPYRGSYYAGGPYKIPVSHAKAESVFTNHPYGCAFRGLGVPQATFAMEGQMDYLAAELGMDPLQLRLKNIARAGDRLHMGQVMLEERGLGLEECLLKAADAIGWKDRAKTGYYDNRGTVKRGKGIACFLYGIGTGSSPDGAHCLVQAQRDGSFNVQVSQSELGQGLLAAMSQIAADALGVTLDKIQVDYADTAASLLAGPTTSSRSTMYVGNALLSACKILTDRFLGYAEGVLRVGKSNLAIEDNMVMVKGKPETAVPLAEIVEGAYTAQIPLAAIGSWYPPRVFFNEDMTNDQMHTYTFGACAVEIAVDTVTGIIAVERCLLAADVGKAINPDTVEGQMQGGLTQGIGWSVMEEIFMENGRMKNHSYHDYLIPTAMDVPDMETIIVEHPSDLGPCGAKGIGEPPLVATAPAIRSAFWDATGIFIDEIPLTPVRVMKALKRKDCAE